MIFAMSTAPGEVSRTKAARYFAPWQTAELPPPPAFGWRNWTALIGPGLLLVGSNIGGGEWLFGPIITARYGGYASAAEYYARSSAGPLLAGLTTPALVLAAADDPMNPADAVSRWPLTPSGCVTRELHPTGAEHRLLVSFPLAA